MDGTVVTKPTATEYVTSAYSLSAFVLSTLGYELLYVESEYELLSLSSLESLSSEYLELYSELKRVVTGYLMSIFRVFRGGTVFAT